MVLLRELLTQPQGGGGLTSFNSRTGQGITQIAMNPKSEITRTIFNGYDKKPGKLKSRPSLPFILSHEIGHVLVSFNTAFGSPYIPTMNANKLTALQVNSLYYRAHGFKNHYDIDSHWRHINHQSIEPYTRSSVIQIPKILQ